MNYGQSPSQLEPPLVTTFKQTLMNYVQTLVSRGQMLQFDGHAVINAINPYVQNICSNIATQNPNGVQYQVIEQTVANAVNQALQSMSQQRQQQPMYNAPMMNQVPSMNQQNPINSGGFSCQTNQPAPPQPVNPPVAAAPPPKPMVQQMINRASASERRFQSIHDTDYMQYSTKCEAGPIVDIRAKAQLTDDAENNKYNYISIDNHIPEPSIRRVMNSFVMTNKNLCGGKFIIDINYNNYILREVGSAKSNPIDLSIFRDPNVRNVPVSVTIGRMLDSITTRDFKIVSFLEEIIVDHFNDLIKRTIRLSDDITNIIQVEDFKDIAELADMRDSKNFRKLNFHRDYEERVLDCFIQAVTEVINEATIFGHYAVEDIAVHLLAHPRFFLRDNNLFERDMNLEDANFVNALSSRYTAFASAGNVVISNFIPERLYDDLTNSKALIIDRITNPFDYLITGAWKNKPKNIIMREGDEFVVMKNGITLDGVSFVYRDTIDLDC